MPAGEAVTGPRGGGAGLVSVGDGRCVVALDAVGDGQTDNPPLLNCARAPGELGGAVCWCVWGNDLSGITEFDPYPCTSVRRLARGRSEEREQVRGRYPHRETVV